MHIEKTIALAVASMLFVSGFGAARLAPIEASERAAEPPPLAEPLASTARLPSFGDLSARVSPAVVHVKTVSIVNASQRGLRFGARPGPFGPGSPFPELGPFGPPAGGFRTEGTGSGFIIRKDGLILSNNHVVDGAKEIKVILADQKEYDAKVLGRDEKTDLAVLKIDAEGAELPVAELGDSDVLRVGEWVLAIGNPFGLSNTVTAGIVSAKGRVIGAGPYDDFIQTDAPINPGNSGGPLFNERGEVVGINTAIFSRGGGNVGIGFAVPVNLAKSLLPDLENLGSVRRGWLGVSIQGLTPELARSLGLDEAKGALVADVVAESPAGKAGFARGDVIVRYDGDPVESASALPRMVAATPAGKAVEVEVVRDGKRRDMQVTVEQLAEDSPSKNAPAKAKWGLALRDLRPEERERLGLQGKEGVLVEDVEAGGAAAEAGVQPGDVILQVNRTSVGSLDDARRQMAKADADKPLLLLLRRADGGNQFAALTAK
jgi:serine protease Do